MNIKVAL